MPPTFPCERWHPPPSGLQPRGEVSPSFQTGKGPLQFFSENQGSRSMLFGVFVCFGARSKEGEKVKEKKERERKEKKRKVRMRREEKKNFHFSSFLLSTSPTIDHLFFVLPMLRRNTRSNKPRLPPPPASHTRPGKWEEQIRIALEAMATGATGDEKSSPSSSAPAGASSAAATKATGAAGEKEKSTAVGSSSSPLPPLPPHPSPRLAPALDPDETAAKGTLLMQPMHPAQRLIDARERRRGRRMGMRWAFDKAKEEEQEALAALLAAAQQNQQQQQQQQRRGGGGPAPTATRGRQQQADKKAMLKLELKLSEAAKRREEAADSLQAALEKRKQRLRARGKALEAELRAESDDDSPGDFSDFEEHRWEREGMALVGGRCWVDPKVGMLYFEGAREEADEVKKESFSIFFSFWFFRFCFFRFVFAFVLSLSHTFSHTFFSPSPSSSSLSLQL